MTNRINPVELFKGLTHDGKKVPIGYFKNSKPGTVPFIVYYGVGMDSTIADDINYYNCQKFNIELYTFKKDFELEDKIEEILIGNEITFEKGPDIFIEQDKTFMVPFYI